MTTSKIEGGLPPPSRAAEPAGNSATRARAGGDRSQPVGAAPSADNLRLTGEAAGLQALQRELSGPPGIDLEKVNQVRAALAEGSYRIDPQQIADRLMALDSELLQ